MLSLLQYFSIADVEALISTDVADYEEDIYDTTDVELDCLLPTGIYIPLYVDRWITVREVKQVSEQTSVPERSNVLAFSQPQNK